MGIGVDLHAREMGMLAGQRLPKARRAPGHGVLVMVASNCTLGRLNECCGRREVWKPLGEVDRPVFIRDACHLTNDRFRK